MTKTPKKITKKWCKETRGKTDSQRLKCHRLIKGTSKLPERKYKRKK